MAKSIASRPVFQLQAPDPTDPILAPQRKMWWTPCKGMNTTVPAQLLSPEQLTWAQNVGVHYGALRTRSGVRSVGAVSASDITTVVEFTTSSGISNLIRMGLFGVQSFDGTTWNTIPGYSIPGTMTVYDKFACTAFGDNLIFSDGISGLFEYNPTIGSIAQITEGPSAKHLSTFAGRIIASNVVDTAGLAHKTRVQWSVKNNSRDWDGIGSGYEDMLSTPGGLIDEQTGVYPVDDYSALVIRSNSVWQMVASGSVDIPFKFDRRYAGFGSKQRHSIATIPGGIVGFFNDLSVYFVSPSSIEHIGIVIQDPRWSKGGYRVSRDATNFPNLLVVGAYSSRQGKYTMALSSRSASAGAAGGFTASMYEFDFESKSWTYKLWPEPSIHWLAYTTGTNIGLTIDSSTGDINSAGALSIDSEVGTVPYGEQDALIGASGGYVYREDHTLYQDITTHYGTTTIAQVLQSSQLVASSPLDSIIMVGCRLLYQSSVSGNITLRMHIWDTGVEQTVDYTITLQKSMDVNDQVIQGSRVAYVPMRATGYNVYFEILNSLNGRVEILGVIPELEGKADAHSGNTTVAMA